MKTLRFFGVCLLASLLCVNFSACGGEDTPEPENPGNNPSNPTVGPGNGSSSNEKRLVKMEFIEDDRTQTLSFEYDEEGKVIKIIEVKSYSDYDEVETTNHIYSWIGNRLIYHKEGDDEYEKTYFTIVDGHVNSLYHSGDYPYEYSYYYDKSGNIGRISVDGGKFTTYLSWQQNKLYSFYNSNEKRISYNYGNLTCEGFFPYLGTIADDDWEQYISCAQPSLFGLKSNCLPLSTVEREGYSGRMDEKSFSYSFDNGGYIKNCSIVNSYSYDGVNWNSYDFGKYYFTWE